MKIRVMQTAAWAGVCCLALAAMSCDALNPALVGQLGGDAGTAGPTPTGSIVLLFNNQRNQSMALNYNLETILPGGGQTTGSGIVVSPKGYFAVTLDCNTSAVILAGIVPVDSPDADPIPLAVNEFRRPALQCGSVISVNLPFLGSPTADLLP